jgi:hypothetical protein
MYTEEKFTLTPKRTNEELYVKGYGKRWGEKITFTVGVSYFASAFVGLISGAYHGKIEADRVKRLKT